MISVVIPLYNKEKWIATAMQSVLNQIFQEFEIIVIDDGSTDNGPDIVQCFCDERIHLIRQKNQGVSNARNKGIHKAQYEWIAFLDADDEWSPEYLKIQNELILKYPFCSVFATNYEIHDKNGTYHPTRINKLPFEKQNGILSNYFEVASQSDPPLCSSAVVVRKSHIAKIGGFPEGITSGEDLLTWTKLAINYQIAYSKTVSVFYNFDISSFNKNPRIPDNNDSVGTELNSLYESNKNIPYLKNYLAFWHIIRASTYMRTIQRNKIYAEIFKSLKINSASTKPWIFLFLAVLPLKLRLKILK